MRKTLGPFIVFLAFFMVTTAMQAASAETIAPHLFRTRLDNGLTVIVKEIPGSKAATVQLWVKTGSVFERADEAGITHLIEHMIFKGTPTRGPGEIAGAIEDVGGRINAYTSYEYTVYHATLSSRHWRRALDVLADAVRHSLFDAAELEREKRVVLEEIGMRNDRPNIRLFQELMARAYQAHPYRLPVIGSEASVASFTRADILAYMKRHYQPENFLVVVVGDVPEEAVLGRVRALFGDLPPGGRPQPSLPQEPPQDSPRFFRLADDVSQSHLALAFHTCAFSDPDAAVLDVIAGILGGGESARLYHRVRDEKRLVYRIDASSFTPRDPGLMEVTATLEPDRWQEALAAVLEEFFLLKYLPVEDAELDRVKRNVESEFVFNLERVEGQARMLGSFEFLTGDPREDTYLQRIRAVRREDVMRVARKYFTPANLTAGVLVPAVMVPAFDAAALEELAAKAEAAARERVPSGLVGDSYLPDLYRFRLANGVTLLVREDPSVPTVAIGAVFPGGLRAETDKTNGAFAFLAELLPKGTKDLSARQMALKVADMAGELAGFNGKNTFGLKADFLARFFEPGLELVRDVLLSPALDENEAEKIRPELLDQLRYQEDSLPAVAFREFNRILFAGHPYGLNSLGRPEVVRELPVAELRRIYEEHARPDRLVLAVVGDVKAA
ncbi:MAG TPA: insulinase family protein, partial [Desulfobacterales bacterium]|nr:insulinase family protein [Desulfobacterales bacterium]